MNRGTSNQGTSNRGKFIVVEGTEGGGKTTAIAYIESLLAAAEVPLICTREPGGTPLAEQIRELLLASRDETVCELTELLLIFAARAQHVQAKIEPALRQGQWVLSDRFIDATYAYQGGGRQLSSRHITQLASLVIPDTQPDLVIVLDLPVELGLERAQRRGSLDRFETETVAFFNRVRECYLQRAAADPQRYCVVDAAQSLAAVQCQIQQALSERIGLAVNAE